MIRNRQLPANLSQNNLNAIFRLKQALPTPTPVPVWSLLITGDVIPVRKVNAGMVARQDFFWPVRGISEILKNADLTLINLEAPLGKNCPVITGGFKFCTDSRFVEALNASGVDIVNLANNHTLNFGWEGLGETEQLLNQKGIETTGYYTSQQSSVVSRQTQEIVEEADKVEMVENAVTTELTQNDAIAQNCAGNIYCSKLTTLNIKGFQVGFLGYNGVGQRIDRKISEQEIKQAREKVNVLIVSVHWGKEYEREPLPDVSLAPDDPKEIGRLFIDWGADLVVGNHPHWYQPFDFAQGKDGQEKVIFYALGNTVFDQEWSQETKRGILARLHFEGTKVIKDKTEIIPLGIRNFGETYLLEGEEKKQILDFYQENKIL